MKIIKKFKYLITLFIACIIVILYFIIQKNLNNNEYQLENETEDLLLNDIVEKDDNQIQECTVDIKGAVKKPGVYQIECGKYVNDVISLAGGLNEDANTSVINLAKKITDEMVIIIYTNEEVKNSNVVDTVIKYVESECVCPNIKNDGCINTEITDEIGNNDSKLININTATLEQLQTLPGIGESKAKTIIDYREKNGNFKSIEELLNVDGIGEKTYEEIKIYITT